MILLKDYVHPLSGEVLVPKGTRVQIKETWTAVRVILADGSGLTVKYDDIGEDPNEDPERFE